MSPVIYQLLLIIHVSSTNTQRRKSVYYFGGTDIEKIVESESAGGAKLRLPKARSSSQLGGLGSVVSSPSGVWGGAPEAVEILSISCQNWVNFCICKSHIFSNQIEKIVGERSFY